MAARQIVFIMSNNAHYNRVELQKNQQDLRKFYEEVFHDFIERLYNEFRYKPKGNLSEHNINNLEKLTKEILKTPKKVFESTIAMREGGEKPHEEDPIIKVEQNIKMNGVKSQKEIVFRLKIEQRKDVEYVQNDRKQAEGEEQDNDLIHFKEDSPLNNGAPTKKLKMDNPVVKQEEQDDFEYKVLPIKGEDCSESDNSDDSDEDKNYTNKAEKSLNAIIIGTFLSATIKRRPKEEKTTIDLENVFVKLYENQLEVFYPKLNCEVIKIEKNDIK